MKGMLRRLMMVLTLTALPLALAGCPDDDAGDEFEEGVEEVEDEVDDAIDN